MKRSEALAMVRDLTDKIAPFGALRLRGSILELDGAPAAMINPSDAIVVYAHGSAPAATFPRPGSEPQIAALILARFAARRAA
jgi:hypothetical protein